MKKAPKYLLYISLIVLLSFLCYNFYHLHAEIQFVFLVPGIFLILFSSLLNDLAANKDRHSIKGK